MTTPPALPRSALQRSSLPRSVFAVALAPLCAWAQTATPPAPRPGAASDDIVQLAAVTVSTEIGTYAEAASESALKSATALRDTPISVTVINHAFIEDLRAVRMADIYQYITGLSYNDNKLADGFSIRGMPGSTNIKNIQIDGLPGLGSRTSTPASANIERVDVLKGPAGVLYGYMEPGGLVNLVTKKPQARRKTELFASASAYSSPVSSDTGFTATLDTTGPITAEKRLRYRLISQVDDNNSFRRDRWAKNFYLMPSVMFAFSKDTTLTVGYEYVRERRTADDGLVAPLNRIDLIAPIDIVYQNPEDRETDNGWAYTADFRHRWQNHWQLSVAGRRVDHNDTRDVLRNQGIVNNVANPLLSTLTRRYNQQYNQRNYRTLDANVQGEVETGPVKHRVVVGGTVGAEQNWFDRRAFYATNLASLTVNIYNPNQLAVRPPLVADQIQITETKLEGAYVQLQSSLTKQLKAVFSGRYDKQDVTYTQFRPVRAGAASSSATVPSFGLVYQPNEIVSLYGSLTSSFHPVGNSFSSEDADGKSGHWAPEEARQREIGAKIDWPAKGLTFTTAFFEITKDNVIEQTGFTNRNGVLAWTVVGEVESQGAEVEVQWKPRPNIQVRAGYAYVDAFVSRTLSVVEKGAPQRNVPHHNTNLWARYNVDRGALKGLGFGVGGNYQSERVGVTTNVAANQFKMPSFVKLDGALYYPWRNYSFALNVKNISDKRYFPGGGTGTAAGNVRLNAGDPRQVIFSVRSTF